MVKLRKFSIESKKNKRTFKVSISESFENFISRQDFYLSDRTKTFEFTKSYNNPIMPIELKTLLEISK